MTTTLASDVQTFSVLASRPPVRGFYDKYVACGGLFIRSACVVDDRALQIASSKITAMLSRAPQAKANLIEWQAELHIIGRHQLTSDLPELRSYRGEVWHSDVSMASSFGERKYAINSLASRLRELAYGSDSSVQEKMPA